MRRHCRRSTLVRNNAAGPMDAAGTGGDRRRTTRPPLRRRPRRRAGSRFREIARVLVIEDDHQIRELLAEALADAGYEVFQAANGTIGIAKFRTERPDLVLTDIIMPECDGLEAMSAIFAIAPDARIVAMSGGGAQVPDLYCLDMATKTGAIAALRKPFHLRELLGTVKSCLQASPHSR